MLDFSIIPASLPQFTAGLLLTLRLVGAALLLGLLAAVPLAVARVSRNPWVNGPVRLYTGFFRGTPMLVQLLLIYYGSGQFEFVRDRWAANDPLWLWLREPFWCALAAFALNTAAYTTEIIAGSIRNVPSGEIEAARSLGMDRFTLLRRIVLPAALRRSIPAYSNEVILMLQGSSIASAVTLVDLTGAARDVYSRHFAPFEAFLFAGLVYLLLTFLIVGLFRLAERRWLAHLQPRRAGGPGTLRAPATPDPAAPARAG